MNTKDDTKVRASRLPDATVNRPDDRRPRPTGRRQLILDRVTEQDLVTVKDLAKDFNLTDMSVRRHLNALAEQGRLIRVRGGARRSAVAKTGSRQYQEAEQRNSQAKGRIARFAAALVQDDLTAFFYSGSTVARVAESLGEMGRTDLTVVTCSLPVINEVGSWADPHLVGVGGLFLPNYMTFVGPQAVASLEAINADVAVVGCDGISTGEGLTTPHQLVAEIGAVLIERAQRTIVVADSSKIGRHGFTPIAATSAVDVLVTDDAADPAEVELLREVGIQVHLV